MISTVLFNKFRIEECIQFFKDVSGICQNSNPEQLKINRQYKALKESVDKLEEEFKADRKSEYTEEIQALDHRRDEAVICLRKIADGFTNHYDKSKSEAGKAIIDCIDKYGTSVYKMNYKAETGILSNLGDDLKNDKTVSQAVESLGLSDVVSEMIKANKLFNERFLSRIEQQTEDVSQSATELVIESKTFYKALTDHIIAYNTIEPTEALTSLINKLNTLIESYNQTVESRGSKPEDENIEENAA